MKRMREHVKNTFIYQMDFKQNKVLECCNNSSFACRRSVLFSSVSEHKWMEVAGSAFTDTLCRDRYMALDQGWIMDQASGATGRDLQSLRLHDLRCSKIKTKTHRTYRES